MPDSQKIKTRCPHCNATFKVSEQHVGKVAKCPAPGCGQKFKVAPDAPPPEPLPSPVDELDADNPFLGGPGAGGSESWHWEDPSEQEQIPQIEGVASNPGNVRASFLRWVLSCDHRPALLYVIPLVVGVLLLVSVKLVGIRVASVGGPLVLGGGIFTLGYLHEQWKDFQWIAFVLKKGNANPGVIISVEPMLFAVYTDLAFGDGEYPAIKVMELSLSHSGGKPLEVGCFLPIVAVYSDPTEAGMNHWSNFYPVPVDVAAGREAVDKVMATFCEDNYRKLVDGLKYVPKPYEPGLYLLWPEPGQELGRLADFTPEAKQEQQA